MRRAKIPGKMKMQGRVLDAPTGSRIQVAIRPEAWTGSETQRGNGNNRDAVCDTRCA